MTLPWIIRTDQIGDAPCTRGMHVPVSIVIDMFAAGMSTEQILELYPDMEPNDVPEARRYAACTTRN